MCSAISTPHSTILNLKVPDQAEMEEYLTSSEMPSLTTIVQEELESPITLEEVQTAIRLAKTGKAPGPDGLSVQYYKSLMPELGP